MGKKKLQVAKHLRNGFRKRRLRRVKKANLGYQDAPTGVVEKVPGIRNHDLMYVGNDNKQDILISNGSKHRTSMHQYTSKHG